MTGTYGVGKEYKTEWLDAGGNVLKTIERIWENRENLSWWQDPLPYYYGSNTINYGSRPCVSPPDLDSRITEEKTTLVDANLVSKIVYQYDPIVKYNLLTDVFEYDYGLGQPSNLLRRTHTDYIKSEGVYDVTHGRAIRGLVSDRWVSSDSSGNNKVSFSHYEYDNYSSNITHAPLVSRPNVTGFNTIDYGISNYARGNITAFTRYANAATQSGAVTVYSQYDNLGNVVKIIDAKGNISTVSYNDNFGFPDGEARTSIQPSHLNGQNTFAFATSSTNPLGWTTYSQFDYYLGEEVDEEDANGVVDSTFYEDPLDRKTKEIEANNLLSFRRQERTIYDDANRRLETRSDLFLFGDELLKSEVFYDTLEREIEDRDYENGNGYIAIKTEYDALGRLKKLTNPYRPMSGEQAKWKITRYDALDRITESEDPDGAIVRRKFYGNEILVTDQASKSRKGQIDPLGRLRKILEDPVLPNDQNPQIRFNYETTYEYDALGNLITSNQGDQKRTFTYDCLSRLLTAANPESGTVTFTYDANNNLTTKTDARGITITNIYDAINRPLTKDYSDSTPDATYTYEDLNVPNSTGKLTKLETSASITKYTNFDILGQTLSSQQITAGKTYDFSYSYDLSGNLKTETYPSTRAVNFQYNNDGNLASVTSRSDQAAVERIYASNFAYASHGAVQSLRLGNGKFENIQFNSNLQPTQIGLGTSTTDTGLWKLIYNFGTTDNNGNVKSQIIIVPTQGSSEGFTAVQNYTYDALNRLQQADEKLLNYTQNNCNSNPSKCWKQTFSYDRYGNRRFDMSQTTIPSPNGTVMKIVNPTINIQNNRFIYDQDNDRVEDYKYDLSGNLIQDAEGKKFSYNGENKQIEVRNNNNQVLVAYEYDGDGNRVKKIVPGTGEVTIYVYDISGVLAAEYTINAPIINNPAINYLTADILGSPRVITDGFGNVVGRRDFMPFGEDIHAGIGNRTIGSKYDSDSIKQKFTSKERDEETGLDYFEARYYSSKFGRFTTSDEFLGGPEELIEFDGMMGHNPSFYAELAEPQSLNKYQYCLNNPLRYIDQDGHQTLVADGFLSWTLRIPAAPLVPVLVTQASIAILSMNGGPDSTSDDCAACGLHNKREQTRFERQDNRQRRNGSPSENSKPSNSPASGGARSGGGGKTPQKGGREGKPMTRKGKKSVIERNRAMNKGKTKCSNCGVTTVKAKQTKKGVKRPKRETQVDHIEPQSKGGSGTPDNGQVLCRSCNIQKGNKMPEKKPKQRIP